MRVTFRRFWPCCALRYNVALLPDARVLVPDEPTTGLDPAAVRQLTGLSLAAAADDVLLLGTRNQKCFIK
jgi:ABC-type transport system involved in cytochrome bd biosynthesis fused ATPase/permease subunit